MVSGGAALQACQPEQFFLGTANVDDIPEFLRADKVHEQATQVRKYVCSCVSIVCQLLYTICCTLT